MTPIDRAKIVQRLRDAGKRITVERELLLDIIAENPHHDASDIYRMAVERNPKIGLATVYRTLGLLAELDVVDVATLGEDHGHYEIRVDDHVHLVCLACGKIREVSPPAALRRLGEKAGFDVREAHLEITGYCEDCRRKSPEKPEDAA